MVKPTWRNAAGKPVMMGVLNCTPDSFSDGGVHFDTHAAIQAGLAMSEAGASLIDVGGESTRPGAVPVSLQEELERVIPVVKALASAGCAISIDTMKAEVMRQAISAGAVLVNDVTALQYQPESMAVVAESGVDVCLMHMQGDPESMQERPHYENVFEDVCAFFEARIQVCMQAGIARSSMILDPGIGFGKRLEDNLELIRRIPELKSRFSLPVLMGVSRKSFLGLLTGANVDDREFETAAAVALCTCLGADIHRVHDVVAHTKVVQVAQAIAHSSFPNCPSEVV